MKEDNKKLNIAVIVFFMILGIYVALKISHAYGITEHIMASASENTQDKLTTFASEIGKQCDTLKVHIGKDKTTLRGILWGIFLGIVASVYYFQSRKKYIAGKEFGTAKWAGKNELNDLHADNILKTEIKKTKKKLVKGKKRALLKSEIEALKAKYKDADALFTKTERISIYNYVLNNNTLILGGSGSGKTRSFVMPNILQAHSSFVITDPKGEILEKSGYFLEKVKGYKIHVLNLDDKSRSDGYNPFAYIHPERPGYEERVLMLIEAIILNTDGGEKKNSSDPFWDKAEKLFLQALFFFVCDGYRKEEQNMNTVLKLIGMLQIAEEEDNKDSDLDKFVEIFARRKGEDHIGVQQYREFRDKAAGKTAKSIVITAVARLAPFRTSAVKRIFSYDSMGLNRLGEEKTAIFVVVPPTDTTFNFIAGMLFTQMFQELQYCATQVHKHEGQRLPVPVRFILDEFANTCTIPQFVQILAYARSFGIGIVPILQSLEQIKKMYKDEWGVIVDNCNTLLYLGSISHMDTLEYMSKLLGKGTFDKKTQGVTKGKSGSSSQNFDVIGRDLMDTAEIRKIPKKDCILIVGGRNPFYSEKYDYSSHPNYKYTSDYDNEYSYEYIPPTKEDIFGNKEDKEKEVNAKLKEILQKLRNVDLNKKIEEPVQSNKELSAVDVPSDEYGQVQNIDIDGNKQNDRYKETDIDEIQQQDKYKKTDVSENQQYDSYIDTEVSVSYDDLIAKYSNDNNDYSEIENEELDDDSDYIEDEYSIEEMEKAVSEKTISDIDTNNISSQLLDLQKRLQRQQINLILNQNEVAQRMQESYENLIPIDNEIIEA